MSTNVFHVAVSSSITFNAGHCPPPSVPSCNKDLSFAKPRDEKRERAGGLYLGNTLGRIECWEVTQDGQVSLPRGAMRILRQRCKEARGCSPLRKPYVRFAPLPMVPMSSLALIQERAVRPWFVECKACSGPLW